MVRGMPAERCDVRICTVMVFARRMQSGRRRIYLQVLGGGRLYGCGMDRDAPGTGSMDIRGVHRSEDRLQRRGAGAAASRLLRGVPLSAPGPPDRVVGRTIQFAMALRSKLDGGLSDFLGIHSHRI